MTVVGIVQRVSDQIVYNIHYAPEYPEEDRTGVEREKALIEDDLETLTSQSRLDAQREWVLLAQREVASAFEGYGRGDHDEARGHLESALAYLENARARKPHKPGFTAGPDGIVEL